MGFIKKKNKKKIKAAVSQPKMFCAEAFKVTSWMLERGDFESRNHFYLKNSLGERMGWSEGLDLCWEQEADVIQQSFMVSEYGKVLLLRGA